MKVVVAEEDRPVPGLDPLQAVGDSPAVGRQPGAQDEIVVEGRQERRLVVLDAAEHQEFDRPELGMGLPVAGAAGAEVVVDDHPQTAGVEEHRARLAVEADCVGIPQGLSLPQTGVHHPRW